MHRHSKAVSRIAAVGKLEKADPKNKRLEFEFGKTEVTRVCTCVDVCANTLVLTMVRSRVSA